MPLQATSGAASYDAFGGGVAAVPQYIEDVFGTFLYTGNGSTQTITNGIDLSTKGGLVWSKSRSNIENNVLLDTIRGPNNILVSNSTAAGSTSGTPYVTATTTGYSIGTSNNQINGSGLTYASWTFREQPKFFDVVTFTSNGSNTQAISHSLGSVPGCIILKRTDSTQNWIVWHRGDGTTDRYSFSLNNTSGANSSGSSFVSSGYINSTSFQPNRLEDYLGSFPVSGGTYVAYLFAHDAGGFGLTGTDNVISCGSFTTDSGGNFSVSLGYEPQLVIVKRTDATQNWFIADTMRGFSQTQFNTLNPNLTAAETANNSNYIAPNATGFASIGNQFLSGSASYIYIAIRRGPMKVPTSGTSVFSPVARAGTDANATITAGFTPDFAIIKNRTNAIAPFWTARLTGNQYMTSNTTTQEQAAGTTALQTSAWQSMTGLNVGTTSGFTNASATQYINYFFKRATGFFDVLTFIGTGSNRTITHNLGVVPELIIVKNRNAGINNWAAYYGDNTDRMLVNSNAATVDDITYWNDTTPTASVFTVGTNSDVNTNNYTYIAYLFATLAGISKVGTYTGTGTSDGQSQTINCGFTAGARFIMIKPLVFGAGWQVFDTARGLSGNEPTILFNSGSEEFATDNAVSTDSSGFNVIRRTATGNTDTNQSGTTYFYLAIA